MTTAIIGSGGIGSAIARLLGAGGESLRLASADRASAQALVAEVGGNAAMAADNRDAVQGADAVILALRFGVLKSVIDDIAGVLAGKLVVVPSNPVSLDARGKVYRVLPDRTSSGEVVAGWMPEAARLAMAFGTMSSDLLVSSARRSPEPAVLFYAADDARAAADVSRLIRAAGFEPVTIGGVGNTSRLEVGGDLHDLVVSLAEARTLAAPGGSGHPEGER